MASNELVRILHSKSGATASVHPFGATLTSVRTGAGEELLFVSRDARLDGTKAIRGGVPLCFPQFGRPDEGMPQHGFLRNNYWREVEGSRFDDDGAAGVSMELELGDVVHSRGGKWDEGAGLDARITYSVRIKGDGFSTTISMENTGDLPWDFQVLLHTYFLVSEGAALDGGTCHVTGLGGYAVTDKVTGEEYVLGDDPITIPDTLVDRVHAPPEGKLDLDVTIAAGPNKRLSLTASGEVDGTKVPVSGVVWNPNKEGAAKLGDFGDDQYVDMICVEPGLLSDIPVLEGGKSARFTQVVTRLDA
eukprot:CAMPEP_0172547396 /NCGR_PEP_ID=MMETSP1067-20121228/16942_1 /TAXON_ID=265564 ORGANISM="Thalassiosira punctigera, Strain Tpunct2005C2" /NCGR_SAMPLE_ID=MMETSP1067 /ASSEMBLY_ACC=CAM_ASM_000444 /LENGTH=303 /DNA_ID=CAMNT_0013334477 /DNA_START=59 /DNA_END=970 /DNA_ORIENTATION=+